MYVFHLHVYIYLLNKNKSNPFSPCAFAHTGPRELMGQ